MKSPLLLVCGLFLAQTVFAETRIFDLMHRRAEEVAVTVQEALGEEAKVVPVRHSLMVSAPAETVALAAELIARLDRPPRMLRVYVSQARQGAVEANAIAGAVRGSFGGAAMGAGGGPLSPGRGGATVVAIGEHGASGASGTVIRGNESRQVEQFLVTLEGSPARISVGQHLPIAESWLILARRHAHLFEDIRYETVETGFEVTPELVTSDQVELTIRPFLTLVAFQGSRGIRFQELVTRIRIPIDSWVDLTGTMSRQDEVSREILGKVGSQGEESGRVRLKVELQPN